MANLSMVVVLLRTSRQMIPATVFQACNKSLLPNLHLNTASEKR
jgi:hypothetical protein